MNKKIIFSIILIFILIGAYSQTTKEQDIITMLEMSGSGKLGAQVMEALFTQFKQAFPQVPAEFWDLAIDEISADGLIQMIVPVYDRNFTHQDIKDLMAFYKTPLGKKFVEKTPIITQESMAVGQVWGEQLAQKVMKLLTDKGYIDS